MTTAVMVALAILGGNTAAKAADYVAQCQESVQGTKIWMSSTINVHRKDLSAKLNDVDFPAYCQCYHRMLRKTLGNDLYERSQTLTAQLTSAEMLAWSEHDRKSVIACVEGQLIAGNVASDRKSGAALSDHERYLRFIRSTVTPGNGIGGLRLGDSRTAMFRVVGATKTFQRTSDGGEDYYYGPNSIEVIISLSPAPARTVRRITLNRHFQGQTAGGGRVGDPREKIKRMYSEKLAADLPGYAVYCDGTTFLFRDGRLDSIRLSELASDVFESDRRPRCSKR